MPASFEGQVILVLNGTPITYVKSIKENMELGREEVLGITLDGLPSGWVDGPTTLTLDIEAYRPKAGDVRWEDIKDAIVATLSREGTIRSTLYEGVVVTKVGRTYEEKGAAVVSISAFGRKVVAT